MKKLITIIVLSVAIFSGCQKQHNEWLGISHQLALPNSVPQFQEFETQDECEEWAKEKMATSSNEEEILSCGFNCTYSDSGYGCETIEETLDQSITEKDESEMAKSTLVAFFDSLSRGKFEEATNMADPSEEEDSFWGQVEIYGGNQEKSKMLEAYCEATQTCLEVKVLEVKQVTNYEYNLIVQFINKDGSIYVFGACCGATEEEMPSKDKFDFKVKKLNNEFKVETAPLYRP